MPRAAIDIGSNSLLLTVLADDGRVLHDEAEVVGLGKGLGDGGTFATARMEAAMLVLKRYAATALQLGVSPEQVRPVATSASRRASNAPAFFEQVRKETGLITRIISGEEEAHLTWIGARQALDIPDGPVMVIDIGGGSTELALGTQHAQSFRTSLEVGSVRLMEQFALGGDHVSQDALANAEAHVRALLASVTLPEAPLELIGVAGTVTTLFAISSGLETYDSSRVHNHLFSRNELARVCQQLLGANREQRKIIAAISPKRADFLVSGATILRLILETFDQPFCRVSDRGIRFGALV